MKDYPALLRPDRLMILLFHGVIPRQRHAVRNYTRKHLEAPRFTELLCSLLSAGGSPVSLDDAIRGEPLPQRAFAVTFDDGFENNASVAAPILRDLRVPATFYVTTGFIESNGLSWTDMLENALEAAGGVALRVPGLEGRYDRPAEKIALMDRIRAHVKNDSSIDPYAFAERILREMNVERVHIDPQLDQKLRWPQLTELAKDPLFTVGGHGHTHRILSFLTPTELEAEITQSVDLLRSRSGIEVRHYSYPEGLAHCYSDEVISALKRHGVRCCPTAEEGTNPPGTDPFHFKRVWVTE